MLFVDRLPVGVIEAKRDTLGHNITTVEDQTAEYGTAKLKWIQETGVPLPFLYEATGVITRFTDQRDPKPRFREVTFHRPETLRDWNSQEKPLRARLQDLPPLDPTGLRDCQINAIIELEKAFELAKPSERSAAFDAQGGLGKMHQLFGDQMDTTINDLNQALTA